MTRRRRGVGAARRLVASVGLVVLVVGVAACGGGDSGPTRADFEARFRKAGATPAQASCEAKVVWQELDPDARATLYHSSPKQQLSDLGLPAGVIAKLGEGLQACGS